MSYKKYIQYKEAVKPELCFKKYNDNLEDLSDEILLKDYNEFLKEDLYSKLKNNFYPFSDEFRIIINSKDKEKIKNHIKEIRYWLQDKEKERSELIKESVKNYKVNQEDKKEISLQERKEIVKKQKKICEEKIENLSSQIIESLKKIKWKNYSVKIEPKVIKNTSRIEEAIVTINEEETFLVNLDSNRCKKIKDSKKIFEALKLKIESANQENKIKKFFFPKKNITNKKLEGFKKDVSMGVKCCLNEGFCLKEKPSSDEKYIEVKIDINKTQKKDGLYIVKEEANIFWINDYEN